MQTDSAVMNLDHLDTEFLKLVICIYMTLCRVTEAREKSMAAEFTLSIWTLFLLDEGKKETKQVADGRARKEHEQTQLHILICILIEDAALGCNSIHIY